MVSSLMALHTEKDGQIRHEKSIKATAAITYLAGADTTVSAIDTFVLAMMLHPEAQRKAQREIDELLGGRRLPDISDKDSLVYTEAILLEVLRYVVRVSHLYLYSLAFRWNPVSPLGKAEPL
jgi:cytochrome P450